MGVMFDGPVLRAGVDLPAQMRLAAASGAESLRVAVDWSAAQPFPSPAQVPRPLRARFVSAGGVPTDFSALDRVVLAASQQRLALLPVVLDTPPWAAASGAGSTAAPPRPAAFAAFMSALVDRYGPRGTLWRSHPGTPAVPIRTWQIWNEPNFARYWAQQPFAASYVPVLAAAHAAIKRADPGALVVLAGLPEFSWRYLAQIYAVPGARKDFDEVAVHPYTAHPAGVLTILQRVRDVMDHAGDARKPLLDTELTWNSSLGKAPPQFGVSVTAGQQAELLNQVMPLLRASWRRLGLAGIYWYTWMGDETPSHHPYAFDYAGLLAYAGDRVMAKPALAVFRRWALSAWR